MSEEDVHEILGTEIIGCINDDINIVIATNKGEAVVDTNTSSGKAMIQIADKLNGTYNTEDKGEGRFSFLFFKNIFSKGASK